MRKQPPIAYHKLAAANTFIGRYMTMMDAQETPRVFDFWAAMWLLSTVVGRDICVPRPRAPVYLNAYIIFVGESGAVRKSTSTGTAKRLLHKYLAQQTTPQTVLVETRCSPEGFEQLLATKYEKDQRAYAAINISELSEFMGTQAYINGMPSLLTDLYDCPALRKGGTYKTALSRDIGNVYVTFMAASTPSWLVAAVNPNVISGGFTSRCLFVPAIAPKHNIAWPADEDSALATSQEDALVKDLLDINRQAHKRPGVPLTSKALDGFRRWYNRRNTKTKELFLQSFIAREDAHVLRCAALLAINDNAWVIDHSHIKKAIRLIEETKMNGAMLFSSNISVTAVGNKVTLVRKHLIEAGEGGITHTLLSARTQKKMSANERDAIIELFHELKMIDVFMIKPKVGRPKRIYRATNIITDDEAIQHVVDSLAE